MRISTKMNRSTRKNIKRERVRISKNIRISTLVTSIVTSIFLVLSLTSLPAFASFSVNRDYVSNGAYGDGQTSEARGPIYGTEPVSQEEIDCQYADLPIKESGHYYGRASVNSGSLTLTSVQNRSTAVFPGTTTSLSVGRATNAGAKTNQIGLEIALGYFYDKNSRLELEYLVNRNLYYNANPALTLPGIAPFNLASEITNNTFLFNGYYDFIFGGYDCFRPFVTVGVGPSFTSVKSCITPEFTNGLTSKRTKQYASIAAGGGIGFNYNFLPRWFFTASFRYIYLGAVKLEPNSSIRLQGTYYYAPISIGLLYVF